MSIQNGVLVIISGVKRYFSNHILGSLRFRIILLVVLFGAVPALIMQAVILNSYETRAVDVRTAEIQNQCTILCNQLGSRGTLNGRADESIQTELVQMSNIYDGRVLVIDNNFQVEEDTYDMDIGRTIVSADVIRCLEGTGTSRYDEENAYIEVTSPVYDPSGEHVLGVLLVSVSTDSIEDNLAVLTGKAAVAWITMTLVVLVLAFLLGFVMVKPFQSMSTCLLFKAASLLSQSIGLNSTGMPMRLPASVAKSMSKPTMLPLSSRKPIGGKLSSRPMTILSGSLSAAFSSPPQPASIVAAAAVSIPIAANFFTSIFHTSYMDTSMPNHFSEIFLDVPSLCMSSNTLSSFAFSSVSSLRMPTPQGMLG